MWQISCGTAEIENLQRSTASLTEQQDALDLNTAKGKTDYAWFEDMISASQPYPKPYPYPDITLRCHRWTRAFDEHVLMVNERATAPAREGSQI